VCLAVPPFSVSRSTAQELIDEYTAIATPGYVDWGLQDDPATDPRAPTALSAGITSGLQSLGGWLLSVDSAVAC